VQGLTLHLSLHPFRAMRRTRRAASDADEQPEPVAAPTKGSNKAAQKNATVAKPNTTSKQEPPAIPTKATKKPPTKETVVAAKSEPEVVEARHTRARQTTEPLKAPEVQKKPQQDEKKGGSKRKAEEVVVSEGAETEEEEEEQDRPAKRARRNEPVAKESVAAKGKAKEPEVPKKDEKGAPKQHRQEQQPEEAPRRGRSSAESPAVVATAPGTEKPKKVQRKILDEEEDEGNGNGKEEENERRHSRVEKGKQRAETGLVEDDSFELEPIPDISFGESPIPQNLNSPNSTARFSSRSPLSSPAHRLPKGLTSPSGAVNKSVDSSTSLDSSTESIKSKSEVLFGDVHFEEKKRPIKRKFVREDKVSFFFLFLSFFFSSTFFFLETECLFCVAC